MAKKQTNQTRDIKKLLDNQTSVILSAVDKRIGSSEKRFDGKLATTEINILSAVDKKLAKMEMRINQKIERLTTTIDKFLKRLNVIEDEMEVIKLDISRLKKVVQEKLGVEL